MFRSKKAKAENLMATGARGVGTITDVRDTGMTVNDNPRVKMTFQIEPLDGTAAFEANKTKTVSRVLRNDRYVSDDVRLRVERAVAELQYVPNVLARTFRSGSDSAIGVAVPEEDRDER